jgi:formylglycine-generating enzyme required for sulfatase activity
VQSDRHPAVGVSWQDARAYVAWLTIETGKRYRLPTEAEWEYACRAGTTTRYAFGDSISPADANYGGNVGGTTEVGSYAPNAWGLFDMHGNVWEWMQDVWHGSYNGAPTSDVAWTDGEGQASSTARVLRGGSWGLHPRSLRSANRGRNLPGLRDYFFGVRVARTLE